MAQDTDPGRLPRLGAPAHQGVELRHLRYLVAVADAGTITRAAEKMFIAQPTLSAQIRRLEELVGTTLMNRRRDGVQFTEAGSVLLEESRTVLSLLEHGVSRSRQAAGLGRSRLRFVVAPNLPERLAVTTTARLQSTADLADADVVWLEAPLDAQFTPIRQRCADAGLGWLTCPGDALPDPLEVMTLGEFEPEVWVPATTGTGDRQLIGLEELTDMDVIHAPHRTSPGIYDAWLSILRATRPRFAFADPPFRQSLPMTLAFAARASHPTAVLTSPLHRTANQPVPGTRQRAENSYDMIRVGLERHPLTATAAVVWINDLPRHLQQVLFDTTDAEFP